MDEVRRKVLLDLFASPGTVLPIAGGLTALMVSWAIGGNATMNFAGVAGVLGGIGVFASRLILGLEGMTRRAYDLVLGKQQEQQENALEALDRKLVNDNDPRTQECLRELRHLYSGLQKKVADGEVSPATYEILEGVDKLFTVCVQQLEKSHDLWEASRGMEGVAQEETLRDRDGIVQEVFDTVEHLGQNLERFQLVRPKKENKSELAKLRQEMEESIRVAKRVEERIENLGKSPTRDLSEYE